MYVVIGKAPCTVLENNGLDGRRIAIGRKMVQLYAIFFFTCLRALPDEHAPEKSGGWRERRREGGKGLLRAPRFVRDISFAAHTFFRFPFFDSFSFFTNDELYISKLLATISLLVNSDN